MAFHKRARANPSDAPSDAGGGSDAAACLEEIERAARPKKLRRRYEQSEEMEGEDLERTLRDRVAGVAEVEYTMRREDALRMEEVRSRPVRPRFLAVCVEVPVRGGGAGADHWVLYCAFPDGSVAYADPLHRHASRSPAMRLGPDAEIARRLAGLAPGSRAPPFEIAGPRALPEQRDGTTCGYRIVDFGAALAEAWESISAELCDRSKSAAEPAAGPEIKAEQDPEPDPEPEAEPGPEARGRSRTSPIDPAFDILAPHFASRVTEALSSGRGNPVEPLVRMILSVGYCVGYAAAEVRAAS